MHNVAVKRRACNSENDTPSWDQVLIFRKHCDGGVSLVLILPCVFAIQAFEPDHL